MSLRTKLRHLWTQLPFFLWLIVLWMLLWGQFTVLAAVTGLAVAIVVTNVFRLPAAELTGRVNVVWLVFDVLRFLAELVSGAVQVAWQAITPGQPSAAIVRAPLRIDDDLIMTHVGVVLSLVPGSTVIEADRSHRVLFLHSIGVRSAEDVVKVRESALKWEARIVRAVGSRAELQQIRDGVDTFAERLDRGEVTVRRKEEESA
ncbi:MAG TPA: Na+/H+ antiporter subunit E [Microbacterium sp.]|nr:Na+/H+ antiporter subunit E [Microbacterium sp.]